MPESARIQALLVLSFQRWILIGQDHFAGLDNAKRPLCRRFAGATARAG